MKYIIGWILVKEISQYQQLKKKSKGFQSFKY